MKIKLVLGLAFLSGLAEATVFFVVPDVALTVIALLEKRLAWKAVAFALLGAVSGGAILYVLGRTEPEKAFQLISRVPLVSQRLIEEIGARMAREGFWPMFLGPFSGKPYKIYAVQAGNQHMAFLPFLAASFLARLPRFVLLTGITLKLDSVWLRRFSARTKVTWTLAAWTVFYCVFLSVAR